MFELCSEKLIEQTTLIFPNEDTRNEFLSLQNSSNYKVADWRIRKIKLPIEQLTNFKLKYPNYEYQINFKSVCRFKTEPESFSVWAGVIEKEINEDVYIFSKLKEV